MRIKRLSISGYRCFAEPFVLDDLGQVVALYGENNSGKSTVLSALRLLGRLMAIPLSQLLLGKPQRVEEAYQKLCEDDWMFTIGQPRRVSIEAQWVNPSKTVGFEVSDDGHAGLVVALTRWSDSDEVDLVAIREMLEMIWAGSGSSGSSDAEALDPIAKQRAEEAAIQAIERRRLELAAVEQRWGASQASNDLVATIGLGYVPASEVTLQMIDDARRSLDITKRNHAKAFFKELGAVARGLPKDGEFELGAVDGKPDVSFVEPRGVLPLRQLGAGTQALVTLLASLHLTQCSVLCLEEPETHQNPLQQNNVVGLLERRSNAGTGPQIFIATHSLTLASASLDLRLLERDGTHVSVREVNHRDVQREFGAHLGVEAPPREATRFVGEDGAVLLPQTLREELGIRPGELVFFVRRERVPGTPIWELMSERAIDDALGEGRSE